VSVEPIVDFRLDGRTLVRLVGPANGDVRAARARLGLAPVAVDGPLGDAAAGPAELTIRYVDELGVTGPLRSVGRDEGAYTDDAFVIRKGRRPIAIVPLERIGGDAAEIAMVRDSGVPASLVPLVNLGLLGHGRVALHGSAVVHEGRGIAAVGWSGGGKTDVLLGFMDRGARDVGDEWLHADPETGRIVGLPEPIRVEAAHLEAFPALRERIPRRARAAMTAGRAIGRVPGLDGTGRVTRRLGGRPYVDLPPAKLFGPERLADGTSLDVVVWLETGLGDRVRVEPIEPASVAERLAFAHIHHRRNLLALYWQMRYAFPDRSNALLDDIAAIERERLARCFAGRPAIRVEGPSNVDGRALVDAIEGALR
jgi:hypothetical protein